MAKTLVDSRDAEFVLFEQLETENLLSPELKDDYDLETLKMIINEAEKIAVSTIAPTNKDGDNPGCRFVDGKVTTPDSFKKAYEVFTEGGWNVVSDSMEVGGQGLPKTIEICCREIFQAGNIGLSNYFNLTHGAGKLIEIFGSPEQKDIYLNKLYTGTWCGTMCLTEAEAGSDVGATKTTAKKNPDGTYSIKGTKTFISGGDHNLVDNIIHMVLARIDGDPPGTKGLSCFIVPKFRVDDNGGIKGGNDVVCTGIEEKMGLHGSSTCSLNFGDEDNCIGHLIGRERQGIMIMFHMMNEARQIVGSQGLSVGSAAYLEALAYAKERIQGVHFTETRNPDAQGVPICEHPDIRYTLMKMKAYVEGCRGLVYYHASCMDKVELASSDDEKIKWKYLVDLLTPVSKAYCTDRGFEICSDGVQILGGYGYSGDFPLEQYLRDERITPIYEGTNGIQAIDLVTRKIVMKKGAAFETFINEMDHIITMAKNQKAIATYASRAEELKTLLKEGTDFLRHEMTSDDIGQALSKACKYLEFFGDITLAFIWLWQITLAQEKLESILTDKGKNINDLDITSPDDSEVAFYAGKIRTGRFYFERIMPGITGKLAEVKATGDNFLKMAIACL